ncbi:MAG: DUF4396 domain-containing protein [Streptosporangiaceae bacterium]
MIPMWLSVLAWAFISVCLACSAIIAGDILIGRRRQPMGVMNFVFPITALYFGPLALAFYWRWARVPARTAAMAPMPAMAGAPEPAQAGGPSDNSKKRQRPRPGWVSMAIETSHCGAGCTLGDLIAEFVIFWLALSVAGLALGAEFIGDYLVALAFGIVFQYFAIAPMRGLGLKDGVAAATKADFISLTAFEIGLFGWMAVFQLVLFTGSSALMPSSAAYWLLMQAGMMIGFATSWPANAWLVRKGIKVPM